MSYLTPGIFFAPSVAKRNILLKDLICAPHLSDEERKFIQNNLSIQTYTTVSFRISTIPFLIYLYKKKWFERSNLARDIGLIFGILGSLSLFDLGINELIWWRTGTIRNKMGGGEREAMEKMKKMIQNRKSLEKKRGEDEIKLIRDAGDRLYEEDD